MAEFTGTSGDDSITGTDGKDVFHIEQGGDDKVLGGGGGDTFYLGGSFTSGDRIKGGGGFDTAVFDGDYSEGLVFTPASMNHVEHVVLIAGHDYSVSGLADRRGVSFVDAAGLGSSDHLIVQAADRDASLSVNGGAGDDVIIGSSFVNYVDAGAGDDSVVGGRRGDVIDGGAGDDTLVGGDGGDQLTSDGGADQIDARTGADRIFLNGQLNAGGLIDAGEGADRLFISVAPETPLVLDGGQIRSIESFVFSDGVYEVTVADSYRADDTLLQFEAAHSASLDLDASAFVGQVSAVGGYGDDHLIGTIHRDTLQGSAGEDTLIGGQGGDRLDGGLGKDLLNGGDGDDLIRAGRDLGGADTVIGGLGADRINVSGGGDTIVYAAIAESNAASTDSISHLSEATVIDPSAIDADTGTAGDQAFQLVQALDGTAGQLALVYESGSDLTLIEGDVDGDGSADLVIQVDSDVTGFDNFVL